MKEMICIVCPRGCRIKIDENGNVTNNFCKRGETYARQELIKPLRMITSTVVLESKSELSRLPVMTSGEVPKSMIFEIMKELYKVRVKAPVKVGDIVVKNILNLGVDIVSTREVKE